MDIPQRINALELIAENILNLEQLQRLQMYGTAKLILDEIDTYVDEHESDGLGKGNAGIYLAEMYGPLDAICGLDNHSNDLVQNLVWFRTGIDKLRSKECFDIQESC